MILVKTPPNIIPAPACPVTYVRIVGYSAGTRLRVRSYDMFTNQLIGESLNDITSSDQEFLIIWATPSSRSVVLAVLDVIDANNNIIEKWQQPFMFVPDAYVSKIEPSDVAYISKVGGITKYVRNTTMLVLDPMLITIVRRPGYLAIYDGTTLLREFTGKSALVELTFSIPVTIARLLGNYIDDESVANVLYKAPELVDYLGAMAYVKHLLESLRFKVVAISPSKTDNTISISVATYVDLSSSWDWSRVIQILAGIGAILAGALTLVFSLGLSVPATIAMIITGFSLVVGGISLGYSLTERPTYIDQYTISIAILSKSILDNYKSSIYSYVDSLVAQGKITSDEADVIKKYVDSIVSTAKSAIDELTNLVDKAYRDGYSKGIKDSGTWIAVAGVGGAFLGYMLGRR